MANCGDYYRQLQALQEELKGIEADHAASDAKLNAFREEVAAEYKKQNPDASKEELAQILTMNQRALGVLDPTLDPQPSYVPRGPEGTDGALGVSTKNAADRLVGRALEPYRREVQVKPGEIRKRIDTVVQQLGEGTVEDLVSAGFTGRVGPRGRIGAMVNYRLYQPTEANMAKLAELLGIQRISGTAGKTIARVFGETQAKKAFENLIVQFGGDPLEVARKLGKDAHILNQLPQLVSNIRKARWDSIGQFADAIEDLLPYVERGEIAPTPVLTDVYTAGRWAAYFEQLDALSSRRVGQALRSMQFEAMRDFDPIVALRGEGKMQLTMDDISGTTFLGQLMKAIDDGDKLGLRKMLTSARISAATELDLNSNWLHTDYNLLNIFRRDNWLSSVKSWGFRNTGSNIAMYGHGLMEQWAKRSFQYGPAKAWEGVTAGHRLSLGNFGLGEAWHGSGVRRFLTGTREGVNASAFKSPAHMEAADAISRSNAEWLQAWGTHWNHFSTYWKEGKGGKFGDPAKLQDMTMTAEKEAQVEKAIEGLFDKENLANTFSNPGRVPGVAMLYMQHQFRRVLKDVFKLPYMPSLRVNGATDEAFRSLMVQQRAYSDAWFKALDDLGADAHPDDLAEAADETMKGIMIRGDLTADDISTMRRELDVPLHAPAKDLTDDRLLAIRKERGISKEQMSDTELRERVTDERIARYWEETYGGTLDPADPIADDAIKMADQLTFTGSFKSPVLQGLGLSRRAEWVAYQLPFFKVPMNSTFFNLNYSVGSLKEGTQVLVDAFGRKFLGKGFEAMDEAERSAAKAKITVAGAYFGSWAILNAANNFDGLGPLIVGGLARDRETYAAQRRNQVPYSIRIPGTRTFIPLGGIDPFDILFLYQDFHELHQEYGATEEEYKFWTEGILLALGRTFQRKASLLTTLYAVDAFMNPDQRSPWDVLMNHVSGFVPAAGLVGNIASAMNPPGAQFQQSKPLSVEERNAMDKPLEGLVTSLKNTLLKMQMRVPGINTTLPLKSDWLGSKIERPFGMPVDAFIPFAPVVLPQDPLYLWLEKVDGLTPPRANGRFGNFRAGAGIPEFGSLTAQGHELTIYYDSLRKAKGDAGQAASFGYAEVAPYVQGKTVYEALNALRLDPAVQQEIRQPTDGKPSYDKSRSRAPRAERMTTNVGKLVDDIKNYYDVLGFDGLIKSDDPDAQAFQQRYMRMVEYNTGEAVRGLQGQLQMGVMRQ